MAAKVDGTTGPPGNGIVRLHPDGAVDPTFNLGVMLHGRASPIVPTGDGHWLAGGLSVDDGAGSRRTLLKLNADGNLESLLDVPGFDVEAMQPKGGRPASAAGTSRR